MSLCIAAAGKIMTLAATSFTLSWTHSVEKTEWVEQWQVVHGGLQVISARVHGSGAGVALPDDAVLTPGGWTYRLDMPPLRRVALAASGATDGGWTLCASGQCVVLGSNAGDEVELWASNDRQCPVKG